MATSRAGGISVTIGEVGPTIAPGETWRSNTMPSTGATTCVSRNAQLGHRERGLGLVDAGLGRLHVLVGIRVLARIELRLRLSHHVLLLLEIEIRVRLLGFLHLLLCLVDQRTLGFNILRRGRLWAIASCCSAWVTASLAAWTSSSCGPALICSSLAWSALSFSRAASTCA